MVDQEAGLNRDFMIPICFPIELIQGQGLAPNHQPNKMQGKTYQFPRFSRCHMLSWKVVFFVEAGMLTMVTKHRWLL